MYISATSSFITAAQLDPDSNHTSIMSNSLRNFCALQLGHFTSGGTISFTSRVYQASAPSRANRATTASFAALDRSGSLQPSQKKIGMGTPQTRWREMHQSGRVATMLEIRSCPQPGSHLTFAISSSALRRRVEL